MEPSVTVSMLSQFNFTLSMKNFPVDVLPLVLGAVPLALLPNVTAALVASLYCFHGNGRDVAATTGGVGTRYLFEALVKIKREDLGLQLATKTTYPSWGYMLAQVWRWGVQATRLATICLASTCPATACLATN